MPRTVTPLPSIGDVVTGRDAVGRELRISGHPESDRVVLSIWQDGRCQATVRLARSDVPDVTRALVATLTARPAAPRDRPGEVRELRPGGTARSGREPGAPGLLMQALSDVSERVDRLATTVRDRLRRR